MALILVPKILRYRAVVSTVLRSNERNGVPSLRRAILERGIVTVTAISACTLIASCGGSSSPTLSSLPAALQVVLATQEANAPQPVGNTAIDSFNWINYRRQQAGLSAIGRNNFLDSAAQAHAQYQAFNNTVTHAETAGSPGFTGTTPLERIRAAGYTFSANYAYGEVIFASDSASGIAAVEQLLTAIYHRFYVLEPVFKEASVGVASGNGITFVTVELAANTLGTGLARGGFITYPNANQKNIPVDFFSDQERPDPVPNKNTVGYPVSIHAGFAHVVKVQSFTIRAQSGPPLSVRLLTHDTDPETPPSTAAIIPMDALTAGTMYDVRFTGTVDEVAVDRSWSFTTH